MKKDFWLERWEREEIGFHQNVINPYLCEYWQELHLACDSMVFVPLCGKSRDMLWLRKQGHQVMGVELSNIAVQAFFKENGYTPHHVARGKFEHCEADGIRILCGDFFDLSKDDLAKVSAVYDRASLIALPPEMRERYVRHLAGILPPATQIPVSYTHLDVYKRQGQRDDDIFAGDHAEVTVAGLARMHEVGGGAGTGQGRGYLACYVPGFSHAADNDAAFTVQNDIHRV